MLDFFMVTAAVAFAICFAVTIFTYSPNWWFATIMAGSLFFFLLYLRGN